MNTVKARSIYSIIALSLIAAGLLIGAALNTPETTIMAPHSPQISSLW